MAAVKINRQTRFVAHTIIEIVQNRPGHTAVSANVMCGFAALLRFYIFLKAIIFRNAPLCPQTVCEQYPVFHNQQALPCRRAGGGQREVE